MLKAHLVNNHTLSQLSHRYGLPDRLIAPRSEIPNLRRGEKTTANLFESYVAGLYYSYLKTQPVASTTTPPRSLKRRVGNGDSEHVDDTMVGGGVGVGGEVKSRLTHGQAMDLLESWLYPLLWPIAQWTMTQLKNEQLRLDAITAEKSGDAHLDDQAVGSMAVLNEHLVRWEGRLPEYNASRSGSDMWSIQCVATLRNGTIL